MPGSKSLSFKRHLFSLYGKGLKIKHPSWCNAIEPVALRMNSASLAILLKGMILCKQTIQNYGNIIEGDDTL